MTPDELHRTALARIEALWDAAPGTPEGAELEALATLLDAYEHEARHMPGEPIDEAALVAATERLREHFELVT